MMFSDDEIKEIREGSFMRPGDEIISIREVCLNDKFDKKDLASHSDTLLSTSKYEIDRAIFRDGFFSDGIDQPQASFAWTEEDGNIASMVSEPGFGTTGQTTFGKDLDAALKCEMKEADTSSAVFQPTITASRNGVSFGRKPYSDTQTVSPTSTSTGNSKSKKQSGPCKVDKTDPRSRLHFVKYVKRHGRTIKLWECSICSREFQHQYTLMRHLPTHTDERNFHCDVCGKSFRQLSTLSQHRAIHSTDRPYSCEVCTKTFNRVSTLISHRKTHSEEKPYKCHICPKGFHQKGNLRNHLFTHTNERPYRCSVCFKGFNQQSNLVCHKNKAHNDDSLNMRVRTTPRIIRPSNNPIPDSSRSSTDCEVSSTCPYYPSAENSSLAWNPKPNGNWGESKPYTEYGDIWSYDGSSVTGVIVDSIKTYHMGVAIATKQTPFALLKPDDGCPVLVKVVDTKLRGGKQMLVPATAEDLRVGGKIVMKNDGNEQNQEFTITNGVLGSAVQIRVPVVATVVPRIRAGGRLQLCVEEPHYAYHTALSSYVGEVEQSAEKEEPRSSPISEISGPEPIFVQSGKSSYTDRITIPGSSVSTSCTLPSPALSPPLDLIPLDLFDEPMECIPMGPQITAVDNIDRPSNSDDSDIFIGEFEV